jgi:polysaccharide chain length determinant protein (PEP-CTERM system associated)
MGDAGISTPFDGTISQLEKKRDELLITYTDKHPDVVGINRRLERLMEQRESYQPSEEAGFGYISPDDPLATNPVYQQLKLKLGDVEAEMAAKEVVVANHRDRVDEMQRYVDRTLEVEAELKRLNRDYGLIKKNYDSLVSRYESLKLSEKVETTGDTVTFRVIDPPRVPLKPSGPDRVTLSSLVFGGALGVGFAIALLLSQLITVFDDRRALGEATGLLVLGSVNMVWTEGQIRKQRLNHVLYLAVAATLFAAYGGIMANYLLGIGLI